MPAELTREFLQQVARGSGWSVAEIESLRLEGEGIASLGSSFDGAEKLVYLNLARNNLSSLLGIEHLKSLATLILRDNRVDDIGEVGRLASLPNLRDLDLRLNPITATMVPSNRMAEGREGGTVSCGGDSSRSRGDVVMLRGALLRMLPRLVRLDARSVKSDERLPGDIRLPSQLERGPPRQQDRRRQRRQHVDHQDHHHRHLLQARGEGGRPEGLTELLSSTDTTDIPKADVAGGEGLAAASAADLEMSSRSSRTGGETHRGNHHKSVQFYSGLPATEAAAAATTMAASSLDHRREQTPSRRAAPISWDGSDDQGEGAEDFHDFFVAASGAPATAPSPAAIREHWPTTTAAGGSIPSLNPSGGSVSPRPRDDGVRARLGYFAHVGGCGAVSTACVRPDGRLYRRMWEARALETDKAVPSLRRTRDRPEAGDSCGSDDRQGMLSALDHDHLCGGRYVDVGSGGGMISVADIGGGEAGISLPDDRGGAAARSHHWCRRGVGGGETRPTHAVVLTPPVAGEDGDSEDLASLWLELGIDKPLGSRQPFPDPRPSSSSSPTAATTASKTARKGTSATAACSVAGAARAVEAFRRSSQRLGLLSLDAASGGGRSGSDGGGAEEGGVRRGGCAVDDALDAGHHDNTSSRVGVAAALGSSIGTSGGRKIIAVAELDFSSTGASDDRGGGEGESRVGERGSQGNGGGSGGRSADGDGVRVDGDVGVEESTQLRWGDSTAQSYGDAHGGGRGDRTTPAGQAHSGQTANRGVVSSSTPPPPPPSLEVSTSGPETAAASSSSSSSPSSPSSSLGTVALPRSEPGPNCPPDGSGTGRCVTCSGGAHVDSRPIPAMIAGGEGAAAAAGPVLVSGSDATEMGDRRLTRDREFAARWAAREREFEARWAAREREFDRRRREDSKEFTAEIRSMLLGAHEALISTNAWLVSRLQALEASTATAAVVTQPPPESTLAGAAVDGGNRAMVAGRGSTANGNKINPAPGREQTATGAVAVAAVTRTGGMQPAPTVAAAAAGVASRDVRRGPDPGGAISSRIDGSAAGRGSAPCGGESRGRSEDVGRVRNQSGKAADGGHRGASGAAVVAAVEAAGSFEAQTAPRGHYHGMAARHAAADAVAASAGVSPPALCVEGGREASEGGAVTAAATAAAAAPTAATAAAVASASSAVVYSSRRRCVDKNPLGTSFGKAVAPRVSRADEVRADRAEQVLASPALLVASSAALAPPRFDAAGGKGTDQGGRECGERVRDPEVTVSAAPSR